MVIIYNFLAQTGHCKQTGQTIAKPSFGPVLSSTTFHPESISNYYLEPKDKVKTLVNDKTDEWKN